MRSTTSQFKRQFPRNLAFQVLAFATQIGIGIWLVPYLINHLGTAAYGLIPIAGMLTQYVNLISHSIAKAVNRFLTIAIQQEDEREANRIFSTAFFSYLGLGLLQIPLFLVLLYFAGRIIHIPDELYFDAIILLSCSAAVFIINLIASVFGVSMYAYNRLDISRGIDIVRYLLRVAGLVMLFVVFGPALRYVGYVDLTISLILLVACVGISKSLAPKLRLRFGNFDWRKIRQLLGMGGWLLVNNLGTLFFLRMDVWVCNRFIGPEAAGEYAAVLQWPTLIRSGGTVIAAVVGPMVMIYYARGELASLIRLSKISVRVLSLALTVPISVLCAFSPMVLTLWLGQSYAHLAPLMTIMLCHLASNVGIMPLFNVQVALGKVRVPALVTLVMGVFNVLIAITVVRYFNLGILGVAITGAVILTAKNAIFTPIYTAAILRLAWHTFVSPYFLALGLFLLLMSIGYGASQYVVSATWLSLILVSLGIGLVGVAIIWCILPFGDRQTIKAFARGRAEEAKASPRSGGYS